MAAIRIQSVSKAFGETPVLRGVSVEIADGEFVSLLGPSGCGKSTLLRIVAGLETADAGSVQIGERDVTSLLPKDRDVAMVFQSYALYPHLTVAENLAVPLRMRRLSTGQRLPLVGRFVPGSRAISATIAADVERIASTLDIGALLGRKPGQLSGGQRQRVAVGRAMVRNPKAFLMDEPLSNLDAKLRVHMRTELSQLHRALAATFLYVTHDQAEAMTMSDRIAVMLDGNVLQFDTPDTIYHDPSCLAVAEFVGSPKINLIDAVVADGAVRFHGGSLPLHVDAPAGDSLKIGFRCETASLCDPQTAVQAGHVPGRIVLLENLGSDILVHVRTDASSSPLIVRTMPGAGALTVGDQVGVRLGRRVVAFAADGKRVAARNVAPQAVERLARVASLHYA